MFLRVIRSSDPTRGRQVCRCTTVLCSTAKELMFKLFQERASNAGHPIMYDSLAALLTVLYLLMQNNQRVWNPICRLVHLGYPPPLKV